MPSYHKLQLLMCNLFAAVTELTMPVVEYSKNDNELLEQPAKKFHQEISTDKTDGHSVVVTVPSNVLVPFLCLK